MRLKRGIFLTVRESGLFVLYSYGKRRRFDWTFRVQVRQSEIYTSIHTDSESTTGRIQSDSDSESIKLLALKLNEKLNENISKLIYTIELMSVHVSLHEIEQILTESYQTERH